ncbi:MAG: hypothetical protein R3F54_13530 [Alphaproteobacteria bacterium]
MRYRYAVCGLGPASCGFLLHAIKEHAIGDLIESGLVLIDRLLDPGAGKVGRYRLTGNSISQAFLDCIDDPKLAWLFRDLCTGEPSVAKLRTMASAAPPLDVVGDFLGAVARRTLAYLRHEHQVPVLLGTSIETVRRELGGGFAVGLRDLRAGRRYNLSVDNVLCGLGGSQPAETLRQCEILPGLCIGDHAQRLVASDDLLMMSNDALRQAIPIAAGGVSDVAIVGGSHSAMSAIDRLTEALGPAGLRRIVMLHREPLRLYFDSADEARRAGYAFDADDVCPMSGRVNRFGGLRYRSFDVGRSILETGRTPDRTVEVRSVLLRDLGAEGRMGVQNHLREAAAVVACTGYQANLPRLNDPWGREIQLRNHLGGLDVDADGCALTAEGAPVPGLFVFGIGSRLLRRSDAIGGERSFHGSADGVWLYHNHGARVVLDALDAKPESRPLQTGHLPWRSAHDPVVSHA